MDWNWTGNGLELKKDWVWTQFGLDLDSIWTQFGLKYFGDVSLVLEIFPHISANPFQRLPEQPSH